MSDALSDVLWVQQEKPRKSDEEELAASLQKALDNTTPERAGAPWDGEHQEESSERGRGHKLGEGS